MAKRTHRFDTTLRTLIATYPRDWLGLVGVSDPGEVRLLDTKLTTVREADVLFELGEPGAAWILNLEAQSTYKPRLADRMHVYSALMSERYQKPVHSVVLLLRPKADGPAMSGRLRWAAPGRSTYAEFTFEVIRLWRIPANELLQAGPGVALLALLADIGGPPERKLPEIVQRLHQKWHGRLDAARENALWADALVLLGLQYEEEFVSSLLQGYPGMRESTTFQAILREGRQEGVAVEREQSVIRTRRILLDLGTRRFGKPSKRVQSAVEKIGEIDELERLVNRVLDVASWAELMRP